MAVSREERESDGLGTVGPQMRPRCIVRATRTYIMPLSATRVMRSKLLVQSARHRGIPRVHGHEADGIATRSRGAVVPVTGSEGARDTPFRLHLGVCHFAH